METVTQAVLSIIVLLGIRGCIAENPPFTIPELAARRAATAAHLPIDALVGPAEGGPDATWPAAERPAADGNSGCRPGLMLDPWSAIA